MRASGSRSSRSATSLRSSLHLCRSGSWRDSSQGLVPASDSLPVATTSVQRLDRQRRKGSTEQPPWAAEAWRSRSSAVRNGACRCLHRSGLSSVRAAGSPQRRGLAIGPCTHRRHHPRPAPVPARRGPHSVVRIQRDRGELGRFAAPARWLRPEAGGSRGCADAPRRARDAPARRPRSAALASGRCPASRTEHGHGRRRHGAPPPRRSVVDTNRRRRCARPRRRNSVRGRVQRSTSDAAGWTRAVAVLPSKLARVGQPN